MIFRIALLCAFLSAPLVDPVIAKEPSAKGKPVDAAQAAHKATSVVRVNATDQPYDFLRPWSKRPPFQRRALGAVLPGLRVLTTAEQVADATYIELEKPDSGEKCPAKVEVVDYECNLAIIKPSNADFLTPFKPLTLAEPGIGDDLAIWQLESNGTLLNTRALLTTVEVGSYPTAVNSFLLYRMTTSLQQRENGFTSPVVKNGALVGMLLRFDARSQTADAIPTPVIRHFLKAADAKTGYTGFPRVGMGRAALRDPQLRKYAGLTNGGDGVYVTEVEPGGPADKAGVCPGDVLTAIGAHAVDRDGNYVDPRYGKISMGHLISCEFYDGQKVPFKLLRQGKEITCEVTLTHPDPASSIIEPYTINKAPRYYILGGVIFQELSRQLLKEWGPEWTSKAPERFLYYDCYQRELFKGDPRQRIVILSNVLPSPCTVGYEDLNCMVVTKVNGVALKSLADIESALTKPVNGFHRIELLGSPGEIILDAAEVSAIEPALIRNYNLPAIKRL